MKKITFDTPNTVINETLLEKIHNDEIGIISHLKSTQAIGFLTLGEDKRYTFINMRGLNAYSYDQSRTLKESLLFLADEKNRWELYQYPRRTDGYMYIISNLLKKDYEVIKSQKIYHPMDVKEDTTTRDYKSVKITDTIIVKFENKLYTLIETDTDFKLIRLFSSEKTNMARLTFMKAWDYDLEKVLCYLYAHTKFMYIFSDKDLINDDLFCKILKDEV